jgi:hypothetical protein
MYSTGGSTFMDEEMTHLDAIGFFTFRLLSQIKLTSPFESVFVSVLQGLAQKYCEAWARVLLGQKIAPLRDFLHVEQYDMTNDEWIACHQGWSEHVILEDEMSADDGDASEDGLTAAGEKVWLPWCETPTVSSFLFSCCYALDEAYRLVRTASGMSASHGDAMHDLIRSVLTEQLTIMSVDVYEEAVDLVVQAKQLQGRAVLNFGEFCMLQFLFDMYFVRATLGFSDFVRFGWGDEIDLATCAPSVARLKKLFERMHDFVDPVDWEIYGPQLIENVVVQFRKSRLLFSSLSEANDISEISTSFAAQGEAVSTPQLTNSSLLCRWQTYRRECARYTAHYQACRARASLFALTRAHDDTASCPEREPIGGGIERRPLFLWEWRAVVPRN